MNPTTAATDSGLDRVERSMQINASAEDVWDLVCRPGWWINDGDIDPESLPPATSGVHIVHHPNQGTFEIHTLLAEPPRYLSYRWLEEGAATGTTVEFFVEDRAGGVTLRVVESGIEALLMSATKKQHFMDEHRLGWEIVLVAARNFVSPT